MKELQQLVDLIESKGRLTGTHLVNFADEESLETKFYFFLKGKQNLNEDDAIKFLYNSGDKKDAYKMLKSRFKKKLYNSLHFLSQESFTNLVRAEIKTNRLLGEANFLYRLWENDLAEKRVLQSIKLARQFSLTNELVLGLEFYQKILVDGFYNKDKYNKCAEELRKQYEILACEREATALFNEVFIHISSDVETKFLLSEQITYILSKMERLWKDTKSPKIFKQYHKVKLGYFELTGKFDEQIKFVKETNDFYKRGLIDPAYFSLIFSFYILSYACLRAKKYEDGLEAAQEALSLSQENTRNRYAILENYFLLYLHSKRYKEAGEIIESVLAHSFFSKIDNAGQERWYLFADYHTLLVAPKLDYLSHTSTVISKDKKGFNTWLLILGFLGKLNKGQFELIYSETERLRKYMGKYMGEKGDPRYKLFLKLLLLVVKEEFDHVRCKQKSRYLYNKLTQTPPAGDAYAEVEVVPFEHLWEFILEKLAEQKVKSVNY